MLNQLLRLALRSNHYHHRHATIIYNGGAFLSTGYNSDGKHSEMMAISRVKDKKKLKGATVINIRLTKGGRIGLSKPCPSCEVELRKYGISKVVYTIDTAHSNSEVNYMYTEKYAGRN